MPRRNRNHAKRGLHRAPKLGRSKFARLQRSTLTPLMLHPRRRPGGRIGRV